MQKLLKVSGWAFLSLAAIIAISVVGYLWQLSNQSSSNMAQLGDTAPTLKAENHSYRDLNKNGLLDPYEDSRLSPEARAEDLLSKMTLAEKAGAMFIDVIGVGPDGQLQERPNLKDIISLASPPNSEMLVVKKMNHFNLVKIPSAKKLAQWHNAVQGVAERTRLGIPVTIASDPRHGFGNNPVTNMPAGEFSQWPEFLGLAATRDPALVRQFGDIGRQEYISVGIRLALHPMADLATEPRWARASGSFGEDARVSAELTAAYIKGFQGESLGANSVATMVKHFSGGGPQKDGEDAHFPFGKEQVYPGDHFDYHLIPFTEGAFPADVAQVMPYYGIPVGQTDEDVGFAFNKTIITDLLRDKYQFKGVICSDWGLVSDATVFGLTLKAASAWGVEHLSPEQRMIKLLDAGIDQIGGETIPEMLVALVEKGTVSEKRLDSSVRRLLLDKFRLGLFDNPYVDISQVNSTVGKPAFVEAGKNAQRKSLVLLKNASQFLPLTDTPKIYIENIDPDIAARFGKVVEKPTQADLAIIRIEAPYYPHDGLLEGFFHSGDLDFKGKEKARILNLLKTVPTVVDIYLDRAAVIPEIAENSAALIANFGATDEILFEAIWGQFSPTGKLPFEMPSSMAAVKAQKEDVPYDSTDPVFPFDFGLSYAHK
jgi:beta-glucosidase